jgi:hypothetical protein
MKKLVQLSIFAVVVVGIIVGFVAYRTRKSTKIDGSNRANESNGYCVQYADTGSPTQCLKYAPFGKS